MKKIDWEDNYSVIPEIKFGKNNILIKGVRDTKYFSEDEYKLQLLDKNLDLTKLKKVYLGYVPFSKRFFFIAHSFLSFEFENGDFISVSAEVRRKKGIKFKMSQTLYKKFQLFYVIGTEKDIVGLRTNIRDEKTYLFPLKIDNEYARNLLVNTLKHVESTHENVEKYRFIFDNCTTNITKHIKEIKGIKLLSIIGYIAPGLAYWSIFRRGFVDSNLSYSETKKMCFVNDIAQKKGVDNNFSKNIRKNIYKLFT